MGLKFGTARATQSCGVKIFYKENLKDSFFLRLCTNSWIGDIGENVEAPQPKLWWLPHHAAITQNGTGHVFRGQPSITTQGKTDNGALWLNSGKSKLRGAQLSKGKRKWKLRGCTHLLLSQSLRYTELHGDSSGASESREILCLAEENQLNTCKGDPKVSWVTECPRVSSVCQLAEKSTRSIRVLRSNSRSSLRHAQTVKKSICREKGSPRLSGARRRKKTKIRMKEMRKRKKAINKVSLVQFPFLSMYHLTTLYRTQSYKRKKKRKKKKLKCKALCNICFKLHSVLYS